MRKVLAVALLCCTVSVFAQWDKFPVIDDGKGEAKIEFSQSRQGPSGGDDGFGFKIRYSPLANLELTSNWLASSDGNYVLGARYQIVSNLLSLGVDVGLPIPEAVSSLTPNVQFSTEFSDALALGTNVAFTIPFKSQYVRDVYIKNYDGQVIDDDVPVERYKDVMYLTAGLELDLTIGQSTLWASFDFGTGIGKAEGRDPNTHEKHKVKAKDINKGTQLTPAVGYIATIGNLALGTSVAFDFGKDSGNDPVNTSIGLDAAVKF